MIKIAQPIIDEEEIRAVVGVLQSGTIAQGPKVAELEKKFAAFCGVKYAVALNSGTAALHAALYAAGIKECDEVITTPFTFVATANPILMQKAKVVFTDISEIDFNIDPELVKTKITSHTVAILPVDLYGQIYDVEAITKIAKNNNLKIIEDACQSVGAEFKGRKAGCFGTVAAFSFYATKNLMCGEGGMLTTDDEEIYELAKRFRHHGQSEKTHYEYFDLGYNYRLTDIAAAIALVQLQKIDELNNQRIKNAKMLQAGLGNIPGIILPTVKKDYQHVFHQFTIRVTPAFKMNRDQLSQYLKEKNIGNAIFYPKPLHLHSHFRKLGYQEGDFPVAEKISKEVLSLPIHPLVSDSDIEYIIKTIKEI